MMDLGFSVENGTFLSFCKLRNITAYFFFYFSICHGIENSLPGTGSDAMQPCEFRDI